MRCSGFLNYKYLTIEIAARGTASILGAILISGCDMKAEDQKQGTEAPQGPVTASAVDPKSLEGTMKVDVVGGDPEKYLVQFSWPKLVPAKKIRIRLDRVLTEISSDQSFFTHTIAHNATYTYSFDVIGSDRSVEETFRKSVLVPLDYVVQNQQNPIQQDLVISANRIYLDSQHPLFIQSFNVTIMANEIHSEDGEIRTFPMSEEGKPLKAAANSDGRDGGNLSIKANSLSGRLKVSMRGEDGGNGTNGEPFPERAGKGRPAGKGEASGSLYEGTYRCSFGANAGNGDPGSNGRDGNPGRNGGKSGDVKISIEKYIPQTGVEIPTDSLNSSPIEIVLSESSEGTGGEPGPPQQGGLPGDGNNGTDWDCSGDPGSPGANGNPGSHGGKGNKGTIGERCLHIGSENINECIQ